MTALTTIGRGGAPEVDGEQPSVGSQAQSTAATVASSSLSSSSEESGGSSRSSLEEPSSSLARLRLARASFWLRFAIFAAFHASWRSFHLLSLVAVMWFRAHSSGSGARATVMSQLLSYRNDMSARERKKDEVGSNREIRGKLTKTTMPMSRSMGSKSVGGHSGHQGRLVVPVSRPSPPRVGDRRSQTP